MSFHRHDKYRNVFQHFNPIGFSMQAIILAGGKGTRLRALNSGRPKILAKVAGKPFLHWQVAWLQQLGIDNIHLARGYTASVALSWLSDNPVTEVHLSTSAEPEALGTAGGLKFIESFLRSDPVLVVNGDSLLPNLSIAPMIDRHSSAGQMVTIAVVRMTDAGRYGTVESDEDGVVTAFKEKAEQTNGWVNGGVYVVTKDCLRRIETGMKSSLETDLFPALAQEAQLASVQVQPPLLDMGTPEGLANMEAYLTSHPL